MNARLYARLAARNMRKNARFYLPYLLAVAGMAAGYYIVSSLAFSPALSNGSSRLEQLRTMLAMGHVVISVFMAVFLFYTNSFLIKQRKRELGLYQILGMEKRHIAAVLAWEALYTAATGIGIGLATGIALFKLAELSLYRLIRSDVVFGFYVSPTTILLTTVYFSALIVVMLAVNLAQIRKSRPIELLRGDRAGEREPKTRWLISLAGIAALGHGYWIALHTKNAFDALNRYFVAVLLVIAGTYCLFTSVSIAVLKLLRANKRVYYKPNHFISISGMLYRMKQNAVGLANICVLSTMVMVMVSGTVSLYMGTEEMIDKTAPADIVATIQYAPEPGAVPDFSALPERFTEILEEDGAEVNDVRCCAYLNFTAANVEGGYSLDRSGNARSGLPLTTVNFITAKDYARMTGADAPALAADEAVVNSDSGLFSDNLTLFMPADCDIPSIQLRVVGTASSVPPLSSSAMIDLQSAFFIVRDEAALHRIYDAQRQAYGKNASSMQWEAQIAAAGDEQTLVGSSKRLYDAVDLKAYDALKMRVDTRAEAAQSAYVLNGSFLFLGVFLGLVLIVATVLIIYYKQISEGYEDQSRFRIMQKVGLGRMEARRTIGHQMLAVFFLPLIVAAAHMLFDFRMLTQLLGLFSLTNARLTLLCSLATFSAFSVAYALVYMVTARIYYRIVQ